MIKLEILVNDKNVIGVKEQIVERLADIGDIKVISVTEIKAVNQIGLERYERRGH